MEYPKIINLLDNTPNQPTKFRTKKINDDSRGKCNTNSKIKFKISLLKSSLCDYSDAYRLVSGTITVVRGANANNAAREADRNNKLAIFKNCAPFTDCTTEINNTQIDNARDLDVVMPIYNLTKYSDNYSKASGSLCQYCRDEPNNPTTESESFNSKSKFLDNTNNAGIINAKIAVSLQYLSKFNF